MKIRVILWALTCSFVIDIHLCHIYTSSHGVHNHLELERKILDSLTDYIRRQEKNGLHFDSSIKEAIENIETKNNVSLSNEDFATPISVYHVLSRATRDWVTLERKMTCEEDEDCPVLTGADVIEVVKRKSGYRWPEADDINLASRAILNVWNVYDLDLETVLTGKVGHVSNDAIDADAVFTIANAARDFGLLYEAIKWFEYLAENLSKYDSDHDVKHSALVRRLALTYKEYGITSKGVQLLEIFSKIDPDNKGVTSDLQFLRAHSGRDDITEVTRFDNENVADRDVQEFEQLCRSSVEEKEGNLSKFHCHLTPLLDCYGYVQVEVLSRRPRIEIYYDVINEKEAEKIKTYGENAFQQKYDMFPYKDGKRADFRHRSGLLCEWNERYQLLRNVSRRLERMTKFHIYNVGDVTSSECYQMENIGPGVPTRSWTDFWDNDYQPYPFAGNRLATVMIQLSNPTYGGTVVFPKMDISAHIQKGSAIVWENLKQNGKPSPKSTHQYCPSIVGPQLGLFKNFLYSNQLFRRPCPRQQRRY
ncbi:prolyl 4-hydroxylase subunit alpha-1-like [Mya arenaria]|uniref:prolyl 4-hydroxylase subunit alpha-1-like n=1 Tax=Mya arenaria TaxID=6604 RepID=UPI0022E2C366|nr:prolyl 4-hydroxylase subunit alpha-1-like [Mya arenaria]